MAPVPFQKLLENNDAGRIENPLARLDEDDLIADIKDFHADPSNGLYALLEVETLIHGGLLAKDEEVAIAEEYINELEIAALEDEKCSTIWSESKELKVNLLTCCVASVLQGWAQGAIVGANQGWADEFGLITGFDGPNNVQGFVGDIWRFSATNAIVYFAASSVGKSSRKGGSFHFQVQGVMKRALAHPFMTSVSLSPWFITGALLCDPLTELFVGRRGGK